MMIISMGRNDEISTWTFVALTATATLNSSWKLWNNNFYRGDTTNYDWRITEIESSTPTRWSWTKVQWLCQEWYHMPTWWISWEWKV